MAVPRTTIVALLLLAWVAAPAPAALSVGNIQCDAGSCDDRWGLQSGDCGSSAWSACGLDPDNKVDCSAGGAREDPRERIREVIGAQDGGGLPETGPVATPQPPIESPAPVRQLQQARSCSHIHEACVNQVGGCYIGDLLPHGGSEAARRLGYHVSAGEDTIDLYRTELDAGRYRFAMGQPPAPFDYTLCVVSPDGTVHSDARVNAFPPTKIGIDRDALVSDPVSAVQVGTLEVVEATSASQGIWTIGVVEGRSCAMVENAAANAPNAAIPLDPHGVVTTAASLANLLSVLLPGTADACYPKCLGAKITSYCFGLTRLQ